MPASSSFEIAFKIGKFFVYLDTELQVGTERVNAFFAQVLDKGDGRMSAFAPQFRVYAPPYFQGFRVPGPPEIVGQFQHSLFELLCCMHCCRPPSKGVQGFVTR